MLCDLRSHLNSILLLMVPAKGKTRKINGLFLPRVSQLTVKGDKQGVEALMLRVGRLQLYLITLIFTGFVIFGRQFLSLWVQLQFANTYYILLCLIFTNLVTLTQRIADDYIYVENRIKDSSIRMFTSSFVGLVISALLAPKMGASTRMPK